jgi:hypothetical protein
VAASCIVPPPRRRASPSQKSIGGVCFLQSLRSFRSQTRPYTAQRGRDSPQPVAGGREVEKNANIRVCVFFCSGRRPAAPAAAPPQRGVVCPPGFSSSHHAQRSQPHGFVNDTAPRNSVMKTLSPITARPLKRTGGNLPTRIQPHFPAVMRTEP